MTDFNELAASIVRQTTEDKPMTDPQHPLWLKTTWTKQDLDGKPVNFLIPSEDGKWHEGKGVFRAQPHVGGLLEIDIVVNLPDGRGGRVEISHHVLQSTVDSIQKTDTGFQFLLGEKR